MTWEIVLETIKVGPKGRVATIPDDWYLVKTGICIAGDMFANTTSGKFQLVESDDIGMSSDSFDALIRKVKEK
ncbi:MAG: hypothetical protein ACD_33C00005G0002 [uncultured bacterium]|nr:MAG: hypothetical protein ACD_33C00005G0002 [uncultured bacterium]